MIDSGNALLMLKKWADEETKLLFTFESIDAGSAIGGRVSSASLNDCIVRSAKGDATLRFRIDDPDCKFEVTDRRSLASLAGRGGLAEDRGDLMTLLVFFPARFSLEAIRLEKPEARASLRIMELDPSEINEGG